MAEARSIQQLLFLLPPSQERETLWRSGAPEGKEAVRVRPRHPEIERVMQEQVRQDRADNTTLRGATPAKTKIVYCKDRNRTGTDFLGR
jgi:hypothetical protein